jgi:hypothetical protein
LLLHEPLALPDSSTRATALMVEQLLPVRSTCAVELL